jgi:hypothetical protein
MAKPKRTYKKTTANTSKRKSLNLEQVLKQSWSLQENIDNYNVALLEEPVEDFFKDANLANNYIIVKPFKENFIKGYVEETKTISVFGFRQIDNRKRSTDQENYVDSPFKYINAGILVAAPKSFLNDYNISIGDVVYTKTYRFKDTRFYVEKQDAVKDYVASPDNWSLGFFKGYFLITPYDVELSIDRNTFKEKYKNTIVSPVYNKTTLDDLIKHHKEYEDKLQKEREMQKDSLNTEFLGSEITIDSLKGDSENFISK